MKCVKATREKLESAAKNSQAYPRLPSIAEAALYCPVAKAQRRRDAVGSQIWFNVFTLVNIVASSVLLGCEMDQNTGSMVQERLGFFLADFYFVAFFLTELGLRFTQFGWDYFLDTWNILDFLLVVVNLTDFSAALDPASDGGYRLASTFRMCRLLRIARHIEGVRLFQGAWLLVQGLVESMRSIFWTGIFICVVLYGFGVVTSTVVGQEAAIFERWPDADIYIGSVLRCILTIFQIMTFDSWASVVCRPLFDAGFLFAVLVFVLTIVICSFGILNMVIALMVERLSAMKEAASIKTGKYLNRIDTELMAALAEDFEKSDEDTSGELDNDEFLRLVAMPEVAFKLKLLGLKAEETAGLFKLLDADDSGSICFKEFFDGLMKLKGEAKAIDLMHLVTVCKRQELRAVHNLRKVRRIATRVDELQGRLDSLGKKISSETRSRHRAAVRNKQVWHDAEERIKVIGKMATDLRTYFPTLEETEHKELLDEIEKINDLTGDDEGGDGEYWM